jgi:hypothetical protein
VHEKLREVCSWPERDKMVIFVAVSLDNALGRTGEKGGREKQVG